MLDENFLDSMLLNFYKNTKYDPIRINVSVCDDLYGKVVELYPEGQHRQSILHNKSIVDHFNGMCFPCENLMDGYNVIISTNVFKLDGYTYYGTFQHEFTHAHDLNVLAQYLNATTAKELMGYEYYDIAMNVISEFNARKNGFSFVRDIAYKFDNKEDEKIHIFEKEIPIISIFLKKEMTMYELAQTMGRIAVLDTKTECQASQMILKKMERLYNSEFICIFDSLYKVLFKYMNEKDNIKKCIFDVVDILEE